MNVWSMRFRPGVFIVQRQVFNDSYASVYSDEAVFRTDIYTFLKKLSVLFIFYNCYLKRLQCNIVVCKSLNEMSFSI